MAQVRLHHKVYPYCCGRTCAKPTCSGAAARDRSRARRESAAYVTRRGHRHPGRDTTGSPLKGRPCASRIRHRARRIQSKRMFPRGSLLVFWVTRASVTARWSNDRPPRSRDILVTPRMSQGKRVMGGRLKPAGRHAQHRRHAVLRRLVIVSPASRENRLKRGVTVTICARTQGAPRMNVTSSLSTM